MRVPVISACFTITSMEARWNNHVVIERALINHYMRIQGALFITFFSFFFSFFFLFLFQDTNKTFRLASATGLFAFCRYFQFSRMTSAILNNWANPENLGHFWVARKLKYRARHVNRDDTFAKMRTNFAEKVGQKLALTRRKKRIVLEL